jgi:hypothetical protein
MPLMSRGVVTVTEQPAEQDVVEPEFSEAREQEMRELDDRADLVPDEGGEG